MNNSIAAVTRTVSRQVLRTKKNSPHIMFVAGLVGVTAGAVLACKATLKLDAVLAENDAAKATSDELYHSKHMAYSAKEYRQDQVTIKLRTAFELSKLYGPAVIVGGLGVVCLTGSHNILSKRNAALTAAYAGLERSYNAYRDRVREEIGEKKEAELHYEVSKKLVEDDLKTAKARSGSSIYARIFDEYNQNWNPTPEYNKMFLRAQQFYVNDLLHARGHVFLNDVYDLLGIDRTSAGAVVGWMITKESDCYIDFGLFLGETAEQKNFINGFEQSIFLDFNVDGVIYDKI